MASETAAAPAPLTGREQRAARRNNTIGWCLIALAFVISIATVGTADAERVGAAFGGPLGGLLIYSFISWLFTRNRTALAAGNGRLIVGLLLCLSSAVHGFDNHREKELAADGIAKLVALRDEQRRQSADLEQKFGAIPFDQVLSAERLASPQGIARSREEVQRFRAFVTEQSALADEQPRRLLALADGLPPGAFRKGLLSNLPTTVEKTKRRNAQLIAAEHAVADKASDILDWAERARGKFSNENGRLAFRSSDLHGQLLAHFSELQRLAGELETLLRESQTADAEARAKAEQLLDVVR